MTVPLKIDLTEEQIAEFKEDDVISIEDGGTGATDPVQARINLNVPSRDQLSSHINNNSIHASTPEELGAVSESDFLSHIQNESNPHNVKAGQVGAYTISQCNIEIQTRVDQHANKTDNPHNVTAGQIGAATNTDLQNHINDSTNPHNVLPGQIGAATSSDLNNHKNNQSNPHNVTTGQIGAASQTELNSHKSDSSNPHNVTLIQLGAASSADLQNHTSDNANPHSVTAIQVGAIPNTEKGSANGVVPLNASSKIPESYLPARSVPDVHVVADSSERSALSAQEGDEAIQLDDGSEWIHDGNGWFERPGTAADVQGPNSSIQNELTIFIDATGKHIKGETGIINTASGELNGRNIADDGDKLDLVRTDLDSHAVDTSNPHSVTASQTGAYTQSQVDNLIAAAIEPHIKKVAELICNTTNNNLNTPDKNYLMLTAEFYDSDVFLHSGTDVIVLETGLYEIAFYVSALSDSNNRQSLRAGFDVNYLDIPTSHSYAYSRNDTDGWCTAGKIKRLWLNQDDILSLYTQQAGSSGTVFNNAGETTLSIARIRK